jgi:hypothetical protein
VRREPDEHERTTAFEGIGLRAVAPASVAALVLTIVAYLLDRELWRALLLGGAVALIVFFSLGYPRLGARPVLGTVRVRPVAERTRRAVQKQLVFGALLIVLGLLFDSIGLVALALAFWIFWFGLIWAVRRRGVGEP